MALDAAFLAALARELDLALTGARIDKIHQPERDDIILALRSQGLRGKKLIISANASFPRVHLTGRQRENPSSAPMFCMLLRKHLTNGKICGVAAPHLERAIDIRIEVNDEMGVPVTRILTAELMGRHSNIILRDGEDRIIECLKRVDLEMSEKRQVLPGLYYTLPPKQDKLDMTQYSRAELFDIICKADGDVLADKWLLDGFLGISPLLCREAAYRACGDTSPRMGGLTLSQKERIASFLSELFSAPPSPCILTENRRPLEYSFLPILQYGDRMRSEPRRSLSDTLEDFYDTRDAQESIRRRAQTVMQTVRNARARIAKKLEIQKTELCKSTERETLREQAELICANIYRLEKGMSSFSVQNYFKEDAPEIEIRLDRQLTPQENSEKLFHDYRRMKNAEKYLTEQIEIGTRELAYLDSVIESIEKAERESDLVEIREELCETGYIAQPKGVQRRPRRMLTPYAFRSSDGFAIYAGRNNRQNDALTLKSAMKGDLWLHTKQIPGSHVIIECAGQTPPDRTITEAAIIAATLSRAKNSKNVPVDYTQVRFVKKPPGARPGMVTYATFQTAFVTPDEELLRQCEKNASVTE